MSFNKSVPHYIAAMGKSSVLYLAVKIEASRIRQRPRGR